MSALIVLIPLALLFFIAIVGVLFWSLKNGQYDDVDSPATYILMDKTE